MLLAGATVVFVPHAGKSPQKTPHTTSSSAFTRTVPAELLPEPLLRPSVDVATAFRLAPATIEQIIAEAAKQYRLDPALIRAVIQTESDFDPLAVSTAGAQGLMQLMPELAAELGVVDPFDPRENIMAGTKYLSALLQSCNGDLALALASYNAGPATVEFYQGVPPFPETQRYVARITKLAAGDHATPEEP